MGVDVRFSVASDPQEWDALVALSPGATGFHDWDWLLMLSDLYGWRFEPLIVWHDGRSVGVFPVVLRSQRVRRPADPPFPFLGPLVPDEILADTLRAFRRWQIRHGVLVARFDLAPGVSKGAEAALARAGVEWTADRTYIVDLVDSSPEKIVSTMRRGARASLRAAERNGVQIRRALPGELATYLPMVLNESYASRGADSPYPSDIGERIERWGGDRDDVYFATAIVEGEVAGVIMAMGSHPVVTGWVGGTLRAFRAANPSTSLFRDVFVWALEQGHTGVDLVGYVDEGISTFKRSLGGVEQPYISVVSSPLPRFVRSAISRLRRRRGA